MGLRKGAQRGEGRPPAPKSVGKVRRSQLVTTYGVGAMVAADEQSFVVTGIDSWRMPVGGPDLREFRLEARLGVRGFHLPPYVQGDERIGVTVRRFPEWYSCPDCTHNLKPYRRFDPKAGTQCGTCEGPLTPSRFVVACENGHLDDFPYWAWVHKGTERGGNDGGHDLRYRSSGRSASLRSIVIECSCGKRGSMEGAFGKNALAGLHIRCSGRRPWLGDREYNCTASPRTLQRGSSSAWFPLQQSALSIPPFSQHLHKQIAPYVELWTGESDEFIAAQARKISGLLEDGIDVEAVIAAVRDHERYLIGERPEPGQVNAFAAGDALRAEEYRQLSRPAETEDFVCAVPPRSADVEPPPGLARPMAVTRLREVRALQTFTRVGPPMEGDPAERLAPLWTEQRNWLPAIEILGEGVFLRLDAVALGEWEAQRGVGSPHERAAEVAARHQALLDERAKPGRMSPRTRVTARYMLVHTFSHALINEWALDAGYPAASMRERLYVSDEMAGALIYTATSDAAGSLGGLVAQASPHRLSATLEAALGRISWCSADPLFMEADASGSDGLNRAACHACVLLPETSCELNNVFLDRAMLIGPYGMWTGRRSPGGDNRG